MSHVYAIKGGGYLKAGQSKDALVRLNDYRQMPFDLEFVCVAEFVNGCDARGYGRARLEQHFLWALRKKLRQAKGEWFHLDGTTDEEIWEVLAGCVKHTRSSARVLMPPKECPEPVKTDLMDVLVRSERAKNRKGLVA